MKQNQIDLDDLIESIEIQAATFQSGPNRKELILKPVIALAYVRFNLGGEDQEKMFEDAGEAVIFYNELKF